MLRPEASLDAGWLGPPRRVRWPNVPEGQPSPHSAVVGDVIEACEWQHLGSKCYFLVEGQGWLEESGFARIAVEKGKFSYRACMELQVRTQASLSPSCAKEDLMGTKAKAPHSIALCLDLDAIKIQKPKAGCRVLIEPRLLGQSRGRGDRGG